MSDTSVGLTQREDFAGTEVERSADLHIAAQMEEARRMVEARFIMAMRRPRSYDLVRQRMLKECQRPTFAEKALYKLPVGWQKNEQTGQIERKFAIDFSIRFAERAAANYGNMDNAAYLILDTEQKAVLRCSALDLETNTSFTGDVLVGKTVERKEPKQRKVIEWRQNSYGEQVAIVPATSEELKAKLGAYASRGLRTEILRHIPFDLREECRVMIDHINAQEIKRDPDAARKKIADRFAVRGISADKLAAYLEHGLDEITHSDIDELTAVANYLDEGGSWQDLMKAKLAPVEDAEADAKSLELRGKLADARTKREPKK